jgi:hypothetical protein
MLQQAYNVVIKYLKEHFPTLPTDFGVIHDLYCLGFAVLFKEEIDALNSILDNQDIRNYETMPEEALDRIAANWLLTRSTGSKSTTWVRITVPTPISVDLPAGTGFTTVDGLRFFSSSPVSWGMSQVQDNVIGSAFYFDVLVEAENNGDGYNVEAGAINSALIALPFQVTSISNPNAATKGTDRETNEEFYFRIVRSANTRDILVASPSIETVLMAAYPSVRSVAVAGKGSDQMERDIVYGVVMPGGFNPYQKSDFSGKKAGVTRYNRSMAFRGSLASTTLPATPDDLEDELEECSQAEYMDLLARDLDYLSTPGSLIYSDSFDSDSTSSAYIAYNYDITNWIASDSGCHYGTRRHGTSVSIYDGELILGAVDLASVNI